MIFNALCVVILFFIFNKLSAICDRVVLPLAHTWWGNPMFIPCITSINCFPFSDHCWSSTPHKLHHSKNTLQAITDPLCVYNCGIQHIKMKDSVLIKLHMCLWPWHAQFSWDNKSLLLHITQWTCLFWLLPISILIYSNYCSSLDCYRCYNRDNISPILSSVSIVWLICNICWLLSYFLLVFPLTLHYCSTSILLTDPKIEFMTARWQ